MRIIRPHTVKLLITGCLAALLCACAGPKAVTYSGRAVPLLNPDENGNALSLVIHVYQLKSSDVFNRLTVDDLTSGKRESDLLGSDLISMREVVLLPGGKLTDGDIVQEKTNYIGVVGFFRQPDPHFWRLLFSADAVRSDGLNLKVDRCYLQDISPSRLAIPDQPGTFHPDCRPIGN
jgi:type VI secretion system protein VasD